MAAASNNSDQHSRNVGEGTSNFVLFDESLAKIKRRIKDSPTKKLGDIFTKQRGS